MGKQKPTLGTNPNLDERFGDYALLGNSAKAAHDEGHNRVHYRSLVRSRKVFWAKLASQLRLDLEHFSLHADHGDRWRRLGTSEICY